MGFSKRARLGFAFAPTIALLICVLVSTRSNASVVSISSKAILEVPSDAIARDESRLQVKREVARLLTFSSGAARKRSQVALGLEQILQEAESLMDNDGHVPHPKALVSADPELNETRSTGSTSPLPFASGSLSAPPRIGVALADTNLETSPQASVQSTKGNRMIDLWNDTAKSTTVSKGSISGEEQRSLPVPSASFQSALGDRTGANPGSSAPDAITSTYTWDGGGSNNNITTVQNWSGDVLPTANADIIWAGTTRLAVNVDVGGPARTWTFDSTAGAFVISGAAFTISDGIVNNSTATQTINNAATLTLAQTWTANTGSMIFGGSIDNGGFLLTINGAANTTANGTISGTGGLTQSGTGTLTLSGPNSYSGATIVSSGVLNIRNSTGLGTTATGTTVSNNATLQLQGGINVGSEALNIRGSGASGQNGALVNVSGTNSYGGLITLAGATTFSSNSGTLNLTNLGTITGATYGLTLGGAGNGSISSIIGTTTGTLTKNGTGNWSLSGANTLTGSTTVNGGTLTLANSSGSTLGFTSSITVNSGATLLLGASNQINNAAQIVLNGGTFAKGSFSEGSASAAGLGALTLAAAGSHLDFSTGTVGIITFAGFAPGTFTLTIDNWSGTAATQGNGTTDRLIFGSNQSGNLSHFNFTGYGPGAMQYDLGNGYWEVVPVPEAGTYFSGLLVFALVLFHHRKQLQQSIDRWRTSRKPRFSPVDGTGVAS